MIKKNLVIASVGDGSLHKNWLDEKQNFDLILIYFGDSDEMFENYKKDSIFTFRGKGEKGRLYYQTISNNLELINKYDFIWLPDDDLDTDYEQINLLFETHKKYGLSLSQPSIDGYVSYEIEKQNKSSILRYTNFVEVLCPLMDLETLLTIYPTYNLNESSWGLDYLWPKLLGYPTDKIAIIDLVLVTHTRPVGQTYARFKKTPMEELQELFSEHNLTWSQITYSSIQK
jgi:hypothetical protein